MKKIRIISFFLISTIALAFADTITFEGYTVGMNLSQINAVSSGFSFDAYQPSSLQIITDPNNAGNKCLFAYTHPSGADILVNFNMAVTFVRVQFVNNPNGVYNIALVVYDHTGTATNIQGTSSLAYSSGQEPLTLQFAASNIRAIQLESGSGGIYIDNIEFTPVPEPCSFLLLGFSCVLFVLGARFKIL